MLDYQNGSEATDRFSIGNAQFTGGMRQAGNNSYVVANGTTGILTWLMVPYSRAAPIQSRQYHIGGTLKYTVKGKELNIDMVPALITVEPDPSLRIHYFWDKYVEADDPFTRDVIEPSTPFSIGVAIQNAGYGIATNVQLSSGQPEIIENEKGLKIEFRLIGSSLGNMQRETDLSINFENLPPMTTKVARWWLITTLQGKFQNYSATFSNTNALGDEELSLIDNLQIHDLISNVKLFNIEANDAFDEVLDFLTNDIEDEFNTPDHVYSSNDLSVYPVEVGHIDYITSNLENICINGTCNYEIVLHLSVTTFNDGWNHYVIATEDQDEVGIGYKTRVIELKKVCNNGINIELPFENAWIKTIPRGNPRKTYHYVNIFDYSNSTENCSYKVTTCGEGSYKLCKDRSGIELIDPWDFLRKSVNGCLSNPPDEPMNTVSNFTFNNTIFEHGDTVQYTCIENGFSEYSTCLVTGNWSRITDEVCLEAPTTTTTTTTSTTTTTTTTTITTTTEPVTECDSIGGALTLTHLTPCVTICSPNYPENKNYLSDVTVKWTIQPNKKCTGGTKVKFIGPTFDIPKSTKCKKDDWILFKQKVSKKTTKTARKCGKWNPLLEPIRGSLTLKHKSNTISAIFSSTKKLKTTGRGFMAEICSLNCP